MKSDDPSVSQSMSRARALMSVLEDLRAERQRLADEIDNRRRVESELRGSEETTRVIIESALDAIVIADQDANITGWNPQAAALFGWSVEEALDRNLIELVIPERHRRIHRQTLLRMLQTGSSRSFNRRREITCVDRIGKRFPAEMTVTSQTADHGIQLSVFLRDITDRKALQQSQRD